MQDKSIRTNNDLSRIEVIESLEDISLPDWGVKHLNLENIWKVTKGEGVKIATIDTGIDDTHPDLKHAIKLGINIFEKSTNIKDDFGHGSMVAGLIAGKNTGVAPNSELYIAKVLNQQGMGSMASVLDGITFAINCNVDILCMSLGIGADIPIMLKERIADAYSKGITIISASGNAGMDDVDYPSRLDEVISVGGVDKSFKRAYFSNGGNKLDIVAPSVEILSTYKDNNYVRLTGTSTASPIVAGVIALLISYGRKVNKELKAQDIQAIVRSLGDHSRDYGHGIINAKQLIEKGLDMVI